MVRLLSLGMVGSGMGRGSVKSNDPDTRLTTRETDSTWAETQGQQGEKRRERERERERETETERHRSGP
jgi:hypothetical protein